MIHTAPSFTKDGRYLIFHDDTHTYIVDVVDHRLHAKEIGTPISLSDDNSILVIQSLPINLISFNHKQQRPNFTFLNIKNSTKIPIEQVDPTEFLDYQKLYLQRIGLPDDERKKQNPIFVDALQFQSMFDLEFRKNIIMREGAVSYNKLYNILHSPIVAVRGNVSNAHGDAEFLVFVNVEAGIKKFAPTRIMDQAPINLSHTRGALHITITTADYISSHNTVTWEARGFIKGQSFGRHDSWRGKPKIFDASSHPTNHERIIVASIDGWYVADRIKEYECEIHQIHAIEGTLKRIAYHPSGEQICVITDIDVQVFSANSEKLICKIPLT